MSALVLVGVIILNQSKAPAFDWRKIRIEIESASNSEAKLGSVLKKYDQLVLTRRSPDVIYGLAEARYQFAHSVESGLSRAAVVANIPFSDLGALLKKRLSAPDAMAEDFVAYAHYVSDFREPDLAMPRLQKTERRFTTVGGKLTPITVQYFDKDLPRIRRVSELFRQGGEKDPTDPAVLLAAADKEGLKPDAAAKLALSAWEHDGKRTHRWWCLKEFRSLRNKPLPADLMDKVRAALEEAGTH